MTLKEIIDKLELETVSDGGNGATEVTGGYAGDLLSHVIANGRAGDIWLTIQAHPNIAAVAVLKELAAVVISHGRSPQDDTVRKAREEGITLATSPLSTFELAGRLYELGIARVG